MFDPFVGTGTVPVVGKRYNREFFGCEIDPVLVNIAKRRLENPYRRDNRYLANPLLPVQDSLF